MKKFLFTLAALMMMGSAYADDYMYVKDFEVAEADLGTDELAIPIAAHFDYAVSAWEVWINLPEGLTYSYEEPGEDMSITYLNSGAKERTLNAELMGSDCHYISAISTAGYNPDKTTYGAVKWVAGDYEEMFIIYVEVAEDFAGGELTVITEPSCSPDSREDVEPCPPDQRHEKVCTVTVEGGEQPQPAPVPTFDWSEGSFTMEAVCEGHTVVLMINGEAVANPYTVEQTYEEQEITFAAYTVANADESANSETVYETVIVPAKAKTPSQKPSIVVTPGDDVYTIEATGTGTVELYVDGVKVDNPYEIARPAYGEADITVTAKASNLDVDEFGEILYDIAWCDEVEVTVPAKDPTYVQTDDPTITVLTNEEAQTVTIIATGDGTVTLKVTGAMGTVDEVSGQGECQVVIPFGDEVDYVNAYATALLPGEFVYPGEAQELMIEIPAKPQQTAKPEITAEEVTGGLQITVTGNGTLNVTIEGYGDGDVITYTGESPYVVVLNSQELEQEVTVAATAQEAGKLESDPAVKDFIVPALQPEDTTLDGEIVFSDLNEENGQFTVTYTGNEAGVVITLDNEDIILVRGVANTYKLPAYGEYTIKATASGVGYDNVVEGYQTYVWEAPTTPPVAPTITIDTTDAAVILGASDVEGADVVFYQCDDETGANPRVITNPTAFTREAENYTVYVYAVATNEAGSTQSAIDMVVIPAKEPEPETAINEMSAGKSIANVRYFNMAGQEMQEANGMTIVVTTYTDGTTSAVKVMK